MKLRNARLTGSAAATAALALVLGTVLMGAALAQESPSTSQRQTFTVGLTADIVSPNPFKACCGSEYEMMFMAYDQLLNFSKKDLTAAPGLAKSWQHNDDYTEWTFDIRDGVSWSDGQPLTSEDIAFTYRFIVDNGMGAFNDYLPFDPTFETPDDTTLIWKSSEPTFAPTVPPWVPILPEHVWSEFDGDAKAAKEFDNVPAVGSGPFTLEEWKEGQFWRMEANKSYWGGAPAIDEVIFRVFDNPEAMVQGLNAGEIDFAESVPPALFNSLQGQPGIETHVASPSYFYNFAFNFGSPDQPNDTHLPAIADLPFRQAIAHAIDKQALVDRVLLGNGTAGDSVTLPTSPWYYDVPADQEQAFDLEESKRILEDAGYTDSDGDGVREDPKTGDPLVLDVLTINGRDYSQPSGKLISGWLKQIGVEMNIRPVSISKGYDIYYDGDYDAYIWGWGGDPDPNFILSIFTTQSCLVWSDGCYSDPSYDQMFEEQRGLIEPAERRPVTDEMQQFLYDQVPEVVLFYERDLQAFRSDAFTGFVPQPEPDGAYLFQFGAYSYMNLRPSGGGGGSSGGSSGIPTGVWLGIGAAIIVIVGIVVLVRRRSEEDRA